MMKEYIKGANPYMPLWEHVPDGEPRVFEYEGQKRVYVYGSHDIEKTSYCGRNYVVYHRQTGVNEYSRQAMMEPIDIAMGSDGKLYIGNIKYLNGEPVASGVVEMTSQGPHINGLDAYKWISAGYACHIFGSKKNAYIQPGYEQTETISTPIVDMTSGTTVGFRYLQFGGNSPKTVTVVLGEKKTINVNVRIDSYRGKIVSVLAFSGEEKEKSAEIQSGIIGKHAVYFEFLTKEDTVISFDRFTFD